MTTDATSGLIRNLRNAARASYLELFFDVAFVFALRALAQQLFSNLGWFGAYQTLLLLLAIGWVWSLTARVTGELNPQQPPVQVLVIATMVGALVLSAAVPEAYGRTGLIFAVTFLVVQIGRCLFLAILLRGKELQHVSERAAVWHAITSVPVLFGAVASAPTRTALWTLAVVLIYFGRWLSYPLPGLRRIASSELTAGGEYLAGRYRALFIIGLGEVILTIGSTITGRGFTLEQTLAFVVTFAVVVLTWRTYVFRPGQDIGSAIRASADPDVLGPLVAYSHLLMITGLVAASVGAQLAIDDPLGHPRATATITILGGTALFLAGRILVEYLVFKRLPANRFIGLGALACLSPLMLLAPPLINGIAVGAVLAGIVIADNILNRRQPAPISPPGPPQSSETISLDPAVWEKFADAAGSRDVAGLLNDLVKWFVRQPGATLPPRT